MTIRGSCGHILDRDFLQGVFWLEEGNVIFGFLCEECKNFVRAVIADSPISAKTKLSMICEIKATRGKKNEINEARERDNNKF